MKLTKALSNAPYGIYYAVMALAGVGLIILAFLNSPWQLQTALGLAGVGFIAYALAQLKRTEDRKADEERYNQILEKLEQIQQELQKEEKPERSGTAIADIITSSLKYYADQVIKPKEED